MGILRHWKKIAIGKLIALGLLAGLTASMHNLPKTIHVNKDSQNLGQGFRVMTANIARGQGNTRVLDYFFSSDRSTDGMRVLEEIIKEENIDIGCFQEIEDAYTHGENQSADIAMSTQLKNYVFGENFSFNAPFMPNKRLADGNAINSRAKLYNPKKIQFDDGNPSMVARLIKPFAGIRSFIHAQVYSSVSEYPINVICTHLSSFEYDEMEREYEMETLFRYAAKHTPAIVMGDLNTVPLGGRDVDDYHPPISHGGTYRDERGWLLVDSMRSEYGVDIHYDPSLHLFDAFTFPAIRATNLGPVADGWFGKPFRPKNGTRYKIIDYVLLVTHRDDKVKLKLNSTEVYYDKVCSDHAPVIADIEVE